MAPTATDQMAPVIEKKPMVKKPAPPSGVFRMESNSILSRPDIPYELANLAVVKFSKLLASDHDELAKILTACEKDGFFYLDLQDWDSGKTIATLDSASAVVKKWFQQSLDEKMKVESGDDNGYKPIGEHSGVKESSRDGFEALRLSRKAILAGTPLPDAVLENMDLFKDYQLTAHYILKTILCGLSTAMGLEGSERFETYHDDSNVETKSTLLFIHHPASHDVSESNMGHYSHTDAGTLTLLFTKQPGLQVFQPEQNEWQWVVSKPGYAVINVGDTLRFMSGRRLRSSVHRVLPPTDKMMVDRYSSPYFLRAADSTMLKDIDGSEKTALEWYNRKFVSFERPLEEQRLDHVATGGMDADLGTVV